MAKKSLILTTLITLSLISCSSTTIRTYEPIAEKESEIIFRDSKKTSRITQDSIQILTQYVETVDDIIHFNIQLTNNSLEEILITPSYFKLYSQNKIISHIDYEEELNTKKMNIIFQKNQLETNTFQELGHLSEDILSIFQDGEEYRKSEEKLEQRESKKKVKENELQELLTSYNELSKNYPIKHTLLTNESKTFVVKYKLPTFPNYLNLNVGDKSNTTVTYKKLERTHHEY